MNAFVLLDDNVPPNPLPSPRNDGRKKKPPPALSKVALQRFNDSSDEPLSPFTPLTAREGNSGNSSPGKRVHVRRKSLSISSITHTYVPSVVIPTTQFKSIGVKVTSKDRNHTFALLHLKKVSQKVCFLKSISSSMQDQEYEAFQQADAVLRDRLIVVVKAEESQFTFYVAKEQMVSCSTVESLEIHREKLSSKGSFVIKPYAYYDQIEAIFREYLTEMNSKMSAPLRPIHYGAVATADLVDDVQKDQKGCSCVVS